MSPEIVGLGECMVEFSSKQALSQATLLTRNYGGDVLNALIAAQRHGSSTGFISLVGNDPFGPGLIAAWQAEGVDTSQSPIVEGENGIYFISVLEGGEREFTYRRQHSAASTITPKQLEAKYIQNARVLLLSGITQATSQSAQDSTLAAAKIAKKARVKVAFDPNYRPKLWAARGGIDAAKDAFGELEPYLDLLLPSDPADLAVLGCENLTTERAALNFSPNKMVAIKAAERGVFLAVNQAVTQIQTQAVPALDTTGAGDAWNGAFLHFLISGLAPREAAHRANRYAAYTLGFRGAIPPKPILEPELANDIQATG